MHLVDSCSQCGFVYDELTVEGIPERLASFGPRYRDRLVASTEPPVARAGLRNRPDVDAWTALEYACHVRDLLEIQRQRLALALREECPTFDPMGREERVVTGRYNEQDPLAVAEGIAERAAGASAAFASLTPSEWERVGVYNWPAPTERTMAWLGRHTVHEGEHHLADVDRLLGRPPARSNPGPLGS